MICACRVPSTSIDHNGTDVISFDEFHLSIDIPDDRHKFRLDGVVDDLDENMKKILDEFGNAGAIVTFAGKSIFGRTTSWTDGQGTTWAISYVVDRQDPRLTNAALAHEKYHALCKLAPMHVSTLHSAIASMGFDIDWSQYDEETRAVMVEIVALHEQGVSLENVTISDGAVTALEVVRSSKRVETSP